MLQVLVNGKHHRTSTLSVTWITNQDELMMHITVRETLTHMGAPVMLSACCLYAMCTCISLS